MRRALGLFVKTHGKGATRRYGGRGRDVMAFSALFPGNEPRGIARQERTSEEAWNNAGTLCGHERGNDDQRDHEGDQDRLLHGSLRLLLLKDADAGARVGTEPWSDGLRERGVL